MTFSKYGLCGCKAGRLLRRMVCAVFAAAMLLPACSTADDSLGYDFVPDDMKMKMRRKVLERSDQRRLMTTRLFRTDSIISSNISYGYLGAQKSADFGTREAGFFTQYVVAATSDSLGFGFKPIFDSVLLVMSVADYKGDTLEPQRFNVYEVTDYFFEANEHADGTVDSTFYLTFDPRDFHGRRYISDEPAFTFVFPDGISTGPASGTVRMEPTQTGLALIRRLMLVDGEYAGNDMSVYKDDELWTAEFKGFYIEPAHDSEYPLTEGAMYALNLEETGFTIYGRNRNENDPELVQDTTQALYYFYDSKALSGNQSINTVRRDYAGTQLDDSTMYEDVGERPETAVCYVEGMGGPLTELHFTDDFFAQLEELLTDVDDEGNIAEYSNIAFNQAKMLIYLREADYDWEKNNPDVLAGAMDGSMTRLGLYTDFKKLTAVADYNYLYEAQYSTTLNYGGYLSRSLGCYELDITSYIQILWNAYRLLEDKSDLSSISGRTVYIAPEAYGVYGFAHSVIQGVGEGADAPAAPIKIELTYTLIR